MSEEVMNNSQQKKTIKKGLGRGLGSLLGESAMRQPDPIDNENTKYTKENATAVVPPPKSNAAVAAHTTSAGATAAPDLSSGQRVWQIAIEKIAPNREQPRKKFDSERLGELAQSIKEKGILLPILARKQKDQTFEIIAGERRWRAAQMAGLKEVPVILRDSQNQEALEEAIIENVQRHDLNPMEEAEAYSLLANKYSLTQQQIADKVGKDRVTIANLMRLVGLSKEVRDMVKAGDIQLGQAKVLLSLTDPKEQCAVARKAMQLRLSVRALEKYVAKIKGEQEITIEGIDTDPQIKAQMAAITSELQKIFGTKVNIEGAGQRGKVEIKYYSYAELNNIIEKMRKIRI